MFALRQGRSSSAPRSLPRAGAGANWTSGWSGSTLWARRHRRGPPPAA